METNEEKQLKLDKRYIRMAGIWAENSYCTRRRVGALPRLHAPTTAATEPPCMSPLLPALNVPNSLFRQVSNEWFTPRNTDWKMDWNY